ncbi:flagellin C [Pseudaminobacter arsenicus]|uniref:Flagellin n=1 Tax=Borborobacter arsenicus TaxID=1851146 RepID=A0A432V5V5_9HYPH|nr:flagellin [Pseudaminobacter arsenicus]RUM97540.1 flagellin C [Pseudaminobacter arsenicus]
MSSILTNASAMTALKTLQQTNKGLETTQGRISTGLRVAQASDNAAYWSIATTMRSDNKAMSTVKDALGLGAAQVDVAYTAMDSVKNTLDKIKTKLVAASQPDVDKGKIHEEIKQLQNDLKTFAESASFSGGNWLSVGTPSTQKVVASFIRDSSGGISLGTIDIDTAKTALFTSTGTGGLLEARSNGNTNLGGLDTAGAQAVGDDAGGTAASHALGAFTPQAMWADDAISFDLTFNGDTKRIQVFGPAGAVNGPVAHTAAQFDAAMTAALDKAFGTGALTWTGATGTIASATAGAARTGETVVASNLVAEPGKIDITKVDITAAGTDVSYALRGVDKALTAVTTAASDLGAIKSRIASQQEFVTDLMNAVDRGVGALVDANMNEESTRLQALQVQQQLGIQALSIANGSAQSILSLFRG